MVMVKWSLSVLKFQTPVLAKLQRSSPKITAIVPLCELIPNCCVSAKFNVF